MKERISKKHFFIISLMLFSMFFGAGNFIFPPVLGRDAGTSMYSAAMFFCITAVALPILGISAVANSRGLKNLVNRVDPIFGLIFTIALYMTIGPFFAIPRASNMPYEVTIAPFIGENFKLYSLLIYSVIYFVINYLICINRSTMINTLGKYLTPILLILIVLLFGATIFSNLTDFSAPSGKYATHAIANGFIDGYQTMDALASLVFGIIVVDAIRSLGIKNESILTKSTIKAGILAGSILLCIYMMLAYIGASSGDMFKSVDNGASLLSNITQYLFGNFGVVILGVAFLLACLTTTVGLLSSISEYFNLLIPSISYKIWLIIWCIVSFIVANAGLAAIIKYSIPVLIAIYPIAIVLIILGLINNVIQSSKLIYRSCVYLAVVLGIVNSLDTLETNVGFASIKIPFLTDLVSSFPFYDVSLGWIVPEIICFVITYVIYTIRSKD